MTAAPRSQAALNGRLAALRERQSAADAEVTKRECRDLAEEKRLHAIARRKLAVEIDRRVAVGEQVWLAPSYTETEA